MKFSVATYNIHKGFSHLTRRMVIHELKEKLHGLSADLLFLQEVQGVNDRHAGRYHDWPGKPQHEFIADTMWHEVAYGRNAIYRHGHHGNALLSRYPDRRARERGHLGARVRKPRPCSTARSSSARRRRCCIASTSISACSSAAGSGRSARSSIASARRCRSDAPMIIAGDFNDWRRKADRTLTDELGVYEVFEEVKGRPARTFPSVHADVPPRPHLCARPQRRRRPRPLRVSRRPHVRSRGAGGDVRGPAQAQVVSRAAASRR